jgi:D-tyrosyl-tRNA(Tyr) deacylase
MRLVIQRVESAHVEVDEAVVGRVGHGLMVLAGFVEGDPESCIEWAAEKITELRIFTDDAGKMNRSVKDVAGGVLLVPNFTLAGDAAKGRRPSFDRAMKPDRASVMFEALVKATRQRGVAVEQGVFRAHMRLSLVNDGPVTIVIDSPPI